MATKLPPIPQTDSLPKEWREYLIRLHAYAKELEQRMTSLENT